MADANIWAEGIPEIFGGWKAEKLEELILRNMNFSPFESTESEAGSKKSGNGDGDDADADGDADVVSEKDDEKGRYDEVGLPLGSAQLRPSSLLHVHLNHARR